ncbi:protein of unknown function [Cupriavidus taiwanensis]|nr:protein of unknown function [Cupriavidus taiwanensis]
MTQQLQPDVDQSGALANDNLVVISGDQDFAIYASLRP